MYVHSFTFYLK